jgi:5-formyltetrahydrofolate cyclo-ligase
VPPPKPPSGFNVFQDHQMQLYPELRETNAANRQVTKGKWDQLSKLKQSRYEDVAKDCAKHFEDAQEKFEVAYAKWKDDCDKLPPTQTILEKDDNLFSKVVKLRDDALEGKQYTYWYVF